MAPFPARHTGKNISLGLDTMIQELGLEGDQWELFCVNDNAANVKLGIKMSQHLNQYLCDIHTLDLCTKDTFKNVPGMKNLLTKTRGIGTFTHQSTVATSELKRAAEREGVSFKKIENPPNTRWSGQYSNLASVHYMKKPLQRLSSTKDSWTDHSLTPQEWKLLEGAVKVLKPVKDTIKAWEAEKEPTMQRVVERLYTMHCVLDDFIENPSNNRHGVGFARELKKQIEKRFPNKGTDNKFRRMANFLAPQFKGMHVEEENKLEAAKQDIKEEVAKFETTLTENDIEEPIIEATDEATPLSPTSKLRLKKTSKTWRMRTQHEEDLLSPLQKEFKEYNKYSLANKHVNILQWWKAHEKILPLLAKVAKKILTIPCSSSKSERVFSTGGNFVTKKRTQLSLTKVEELIIIKENKSQIEIFKEKSGYELKQNKQEPFNLISVNEVIANIVEAEELDFILEDEGTSEDEEEEEVLFDVHHLDDTGDESDFDEDTHLENSD